MGILIKLDENRTELQNRLATELQEKAKQRAKLADRPDGVNDSNYIKDTKSTTSLAWVWILLIVITLALIIWIISIGVVR